MTPKVDQRLGPGVSVPLNPLLGRADTLQEIEMLLADPEVRLVTLTGPGGVGKSHLAMQIAVNAAQQFDDGAIFLSLAPVRDADLILRSIAEMLGVSEGDQPLIERIEARLLGRRVLIVLDNFEQILDAGPVVSRLLGRSPGLKALVTSRVLLRVRGEHVVSIPPLPLPSQSRANGEISIWENPAVRLFVDRARAAGGTVKETEDNAVAISAICRRLDGLPLAIELAAAMSPVLSPRQMLVRLQQSLPLLTGGARDAPARQRTMSDAIAWSYELLDPDHRSLFRRLSVCSGGFSFEVAEYLARSWQPADGYPFAGGRAVNDISWWLPRGKESPADAGEWDPLVLPPLNLHAVQGVWTLASQNLVRIVSGDGEALRFEMLETIRDFGLERLAAAGESWAARHAHAARFLAEAEAAGLGLWGRERRYWARVLRDDINNMRSALGWLALQDQPANQLSLRLAEALWPYWHMFGHATEGRGWLERALAREGGTPLARAQAQVVLGMLAWVQGDDDRATAVLREALQILRVHGAESALARCLFGLSLVAWRRGDFEQMLTMAKEALPLFQLVDDPTGTGFCLSVMALVARRTGDYETAAVLLTQAEASFAVADFRWGMAAAHYYAGEVARERGDEGQGERFIQEALDQYAEWGDPWGMGACVVALASVAHVRQQDERAATLFGAGFALCDTIGAFLPPTELERYRAVAEELKRELGSDVYETLASLGRTMPPGQVVQLALGQADDTADEESASPTIIASEPPPIQFTRRQFEVIQLLAKGHPVKEIAQAWDCGGSNVYGHIRKACERAGVATVPELIAYAARRGIVE